MGKEKKDQHDQEMAEVTPGYDSLENRALYFWPGNRSATTGTLRCSRRKTDAAIAAAVKLVWVKRGAHFIANKL